VKTQSQPSTSYVVIFFIAVLLALGIGYRFNSVITDHERVDQHMERFDYR
jgi:hypothetical protein